MSNLNISSSGITFVKFSAEWCGPCKLLDKTLAAFEAMPDFHLDKHDIDDDAELAGSEDIMSVPTVKCYRDGEYFGKFVGAVPAQFIEGVINGTKQLEK